MLIDRISYISIHLVFVILAFAISASVARFIIPHILMISFRKKLFDIPDERKLHKRAIPRLGGVAFFPTILFSCCAVLAFCTLTGYSIPLIQAIYILPECLLLICGMILLYLTGIADDLMGVRYREKFLIQLICACFFPLSGLWINDFYGLFGIYLIPAWIGMPFTVLIVIFVTNAINLIDGIDGLCSGLVGMGALVFGFLFIYNGAWLHAVFAFITAGVLCPFFYYNVFGKSKGRQRIFMGDTGSLTLGLSMAFLAISYAMNNPLIKPFSEGAIVVSFATLIVPLFDVVRVVWIRYRSHQPFFMPDQNHIHHKFLRMGLSHYATMALILALAFFLSFFNIIAVEYISNNIVIFIDIVLWVAFHLWLDRRELIRTKHGIVND